MPKTPEDTTEVRERKKIVTLYMLALGKEQLSMQTWKKLARVNQLVLDGKK